MLKNPTNDTIMSISSFDQIVNFKWLEMIIDNHKNCDESPKNKKGY